MKRTISLLIIVIGLTSPLFSQTEEEFEKLRGLYQQGSKAYQMREFTGAVGAFAEFIKLLPEKEDFTRARAEAHMNIARCHALTQKAKEALEHLDHAIKHGYDEIEVLKKDPDLNSLRKLPEFAALVENFRKAKEEALQKALKKFDFNLKTVDGKPIAKKDYLGKVLIVDIWGTWCPPCRMEIPHFVELMKKREKDGLQIIGLNHERGAPNAEKAAALVKDFIDNNDVNYPCALIPPDLLASIPNFSGYPTTLFFDRQGKPRQLEVGYHDLKDLEDIIEPLLKEKAPDVPAKEENQEKGNKPSEKPAKKPAEKNEEKKG